MIGIIIAYFVLKHANLRMMAWVYDPRQYVSPTKPNSDVPWCLERLSKPHWVGLDNLNKFLGASTILIFTNIMDINNFCLSLTLRVPTNNPMLTTRIVYYGFCGFGAVRECYNNIS